MILRFFIFLFFAQCAYKGYSQSNTRIKVYKNKKYEVIGTDEHITLYKKCNTNKYYFSPLLGNNLKRLNYFRIIHKNANTYKIRENCRELRRRKIKLYQKHNDGEYYIFKVYNSYIQ